METKNNILRNLANKETRNKQRELENMSNIMKRTGRVLLNINMTVR